MYTIIIGDQAYSSWSMRGWLSLAAFDLPFEARVVPMYTDAFTEMMAAQAPAKTVPILEWQEDGARRRVWDSAAILETLAERHPEAGHWPHEARHREIARILVAEMHSGLGTLRGHAPMNLHRDDRPLVEVPGDLHADVAQLEALWAWAWAETGGPWLAGPAFSAADAFYAPVVFRLTGYRLATPSMGGYCTQLQGHPAVRRWAAEAKADPRRVAKYEAIP